MNARHIMAAAALVMMFAMGCGGQQTKTNNILTCQHFERAIQSEEIATIQDLYGRLASELAAGRIKEALSDVNAKAAEFVPIDKWLENIYMQVPNEGRTKDEALALLANEVSWKSDERDLRAITRAYLESTRYPTKAERQLNWDNPVHFTVFTNERGEIICWRRVE